MKIYLYDIIEATMVSGLCVGLFCLIMIAVGIFYPCFLFVTFVGELVGFSLLIVMAICVIIEIN